MAIAVLVIEAVGKFTVGLTVAHATVQHEVRISVSGAPISQGPGDPHAVRLREQRPRDSPERPRAGKPIRIPFHHGDFKKIYSILGLKQ